ncbi:hypothetical protein [Cellvibrio polysaccharolyticus]|uniref:Uncharacterized protein n=1 Tax=Cellvibrio polysaccharolyticus TaxID=2082724 RepID=A0A928V564_9GAMM|nr:hypothetical protein [Cellvibrio polysaccharolyticus]MBE8717066.1 hypothetical protein [Cellvibrio polysaccharolyticus]
MEAARKFQSGLIRINHIDQTHECEAYILMRLRGRYDALFAVKEGNSHRYLSADRNNYTGVVAYWNNVPSGKRQAASGKRQAAKGNGGQYSKSARAGRNLPSASHAAESELNACNGQKSTSS